MVKVSANIPDSVNRELRELVLELVGVEGYHGAIQKFVRFALRYTLDQARNDDEVKKSLKLALSK